MNDCKHILEHLSQYMFHNDFHQSLNTECKSRSSSIIKKNKDIKNTDVKAIFIPQEKDKLFWCFYIIKNGLDKYHSITQNYFQIEMNFKISTAEKLAQNDVLLKQNKLKREKIESELVNDKTISLTGLHALALLYNINILLIFDHFFYRMSGVSDDEPYILEKDTNGNYGIISNLSEERKKIIYDKYYEIEDYRKPVRTISAYKVDDIRNIAQKLGILHCDNLGNKKTKKILYEEIISSLQL